MSPISTIPTTSPGRNKLHIKNTRFYTTRLLSTYLLSAYLTYLLSAYFLPSSRYLLGTFYLLSAYFRPTFYLAPFGLPSYLLLPPLPSSFLPSSRYLPGTFYLLLHWQKFFEKGIPPLFWPKKAKKDRTKPTPHKKPYFAWGAGRRSQSRLYIYMCTSRVKLVAMTPYIIWPKIKNRKILCHSMFTHLAASEFHLYFFGIFRKKSKNHYLQL